MSYAPASLKDLIAYLATATGVATSQFGIVGNWSGHCGGYHLGRDRIYSNCACKPGGVCKPGLGDGDYSVRTARDKAGLTDAASAIDIKFGTNYDLLRKLSVWIVGQCIAGAADTLDISEVVYSPDGAQVKVWDRELFFSTADSSHLWHTHISYYRDSESRDKTALFRRYFEGAMDTGFKLVSSPIGTFVLGSGHALISVEDTGHHFSYGSWPGGRTTFPVGAALDLVRQLDGAPVDLEGNSPPLNKRNEVYLLSDPAFGSDVYALRQDGVFTPAVDALQANYDALKAKLQTAEADKASAVADAVQRTKASAVPKIIVEFP